MMRRIQIWTCPLMICLCGCGTVMNLRTPADSAAIGTSPDRIPKQVYGGVKLDAAAGRRSFQAAEERPAQALVGAYVWGIDLPVSAVADTITLPVTLKAAMNRRLESYYYSDETGEDLSDE